MLTTVDHPPLVVVHVPAQRGVGPITERIHRALQKRIATPASAPVNPLLSPVLSSTLPPAVTR